MKKYKVIALSVGGSSNRIYNSGDIVPENAFPEGHAEILVKEGFLKPYEEEEEVIEPKPGAITEVVVPEETPVEEAPAEEAPKSKSKKK